MRGSELACGERNINSSVVFLDGAVRLAVDNVDVFVRGMILSAGLIAEATLVMWGLPLESQTACLSRSTSLSQRFPGLIKSKQQLVLPVLTPSGYHP